MSYQVTWTDRHTNEDHSADHGDDIESARRDANTKSNLHCGAMVLNMEDGEVVGSISYAFGRRGEVDGDM